MMYLQYNTKEKNTTLGMPKLRSERCTDSTFSVTTGDESFDNEEAYPLTDDVYSFIVAAPVTSTPFLFAFYVILVKYLVYGILASGIEASDLPDSASVQVVKFLLIPVAIAMQEDLIHVYASIANITYDENVLEISSSATKCKLIFSFVLRFIDGVLSLGVNFAVMLTTDGGVLSVLLNFAALHFLQSIDDVFFVLVEKGFFGDVMEHMSNLCKQIAFPRRTSHSGCMTALDSILFFLTLVICFAIYGVFVSEVFE